MESAHRISRDELIDLAASRSYVITMPDQERAAVLAGVAHLADALLGANGAGELVLPYVTECYRARLSSTWPGRESRRWALARPAASQPWPGVRRRASAGSVGTPAYRDSVIMLDGSVRKLAQAAGRACATRGPRNPAAPLGTLDFVVVDVETTGWSPDADGITEIGAVRLSGGEVRAESPPWSTQASRSRPTSSR